MNKKSEDLRLRRLADLWLTFFVTACITVSILCWCYNPHFVLSNNEYPVEPVWFWLYAIIFFVGIEGFYFLAEYQNEKRGNNWTSSKVLALLTSTLAVMLTLIFTGAFYWLIRFIIGHVPDVLTVLGYSCLIVGGLFIYFMINRCFRRKK